VARSDPVHVLFAVYTGMTLTLVSHSGVLLVSEGPRIELRVEPGPVGCEKGRGKAGPKPDILKFLKFVYVINVSCMYTSPPDRRDGRSIFVR
jgi:hypothetical protein